VAAKSDDGDFRILVCDCEGSNALDRSAMESAIGKPLDLCGTQLCRRQLPEFEARLKGTQPLIIGCTQEAPLFMESINDAGFDGDVRFVNIREKAGWSQDAGRASAKMSALIAEAMLNIDGPGTVTMTSAGAVLIIGRDDVAVDAATRLGQRMDATLLLVGATEVDPPRTIDVPVFHATTINASGHLGAFELEIEDFAAMAPSARQFLSFDHAAPNRTRSECDIILDLRGATPLFNAPDKRDGYFNPDPQSPGAVALALFEIADLIGEFEKPRYVAYDAAICVHARNGIVGCSLCLDNCPTGAISSVGDAIKVDPFVCAGCGNCAGVCPTGAVRYTMPESDLLLQRIRTVLGTYGTAGGDHPVLLFHDGAFGEDMIAIIARHYDGLPANVLPVAVNAVSQCGLEAFLGARAFGAEKSVVLVSPAAESDVASLAGAAELSNHIVSSLGYEDGRVALLHESDPEIVSQRLWAEAKSTDARAQAKPFVPIGGKRALMALALGTLHEAAPKPVDVIELPDGAPFGTVEVEVAGCTLCLACAGVCPANALRDSPEHPRLSFVENACVQCGLCAKTCPEGVISLRPRLDFTRAARNPRVIKEEEPFECLRCGTPFATKSMIDKVVAAMASHVMFADEQALRRLKMCADCRVIDMAETQTDPMHAGLRPKPRTTDDYLSGAITDDSDDD